MLAEVRRCFSRALAKRSLLICNFIFIGSAGSREKGDDVQPQLRLQKELLPESVAISRVKPLIPSCRALCQGRIAALARSALLPATACSNPVILQVVLAPPPWVEIHLSGQPGSNPAGVRLVWSGQVPLSQANLVGRRGFTSPVCLEASFCTSVESKRGSSSCIPLPREEVRPCRNCRGNAVLREHMPARGTCCCSMKVFQLYG